MKTIKEAKKAPSDEACYFHHTDQSIFEWGFESGVEEAQRWIPISELKETGIDLIFKKSDGRHCVGKFEFLESKLCVVTDLGYSLLEDSGFTHFRPIQRT